MIPSPAGRLICSRDILDKLLNNYKDTFGIIDHTTYFAVEEKKLDRAEITTRNVINTYIEIVNRGYL